MMTESGVIVTFSGSESLLDSAAFNELIATFSHHLPLRNLHWKPSNSYNGAGNDGHFTPFNSTLPHPTSIRTIQSLSVRLEPMADTLLRSKLKPETRHLILRSLLERPYCHLYFVVCDDSDVYRSRIRNDIRNWLSTIQNNSALSAANVTAKGFQGVESLHRHKNGSTSSLSNGTLTPRSSTPPLRPDTPSKDTPQEESSSSMINSSTSKDKLPPPSPEYLIVVISPPDGSPLPPSATGRNSPAPLPNSNSQVDLSEKQSANAKSGLGRFYSSNTSVKNSVIDKVKSDFNTSRRDRVVHLSRLPNLTPGSKSRSRHTDPTIFAELQTRLKECISATFDAVVETQGDIIKREGQKKSLPGWNYCKWMAGVECIASTFEGVGLYSDALAQFEDIDAGFLQCLQEKNLPFFFHFGGDAIGDDSAPLLDIGKKNYREMILRNEITLFDFRNYIFAKRAILLGKLGRVAQVMSETPTFLNRIAIMLQGKDLPAHFIESWMFSCAIDVVEQCQAWLVARGDMSPLSGDIDLEEKNNGDSTQSKEARLNTSFHSAKAELLDLARRQLDKIGIAVGHLPNNLPFSLSLPHGIDSNDRQLPPIPGEKQQIKGKSITRQELLSAIDNQEIFDLHYVSITERIIASWTNGGRGRNVKRLRYVIANLDCLREKYAEAYAKFKTLSEPYSTEKWTNIEAHHLAKFLECHDRISQAHDRSWALALMSLLDTRAAHSNSKVKGGHDNSSRWLNPSFLCQQLKKNTTMLQQEIPISKFESVEVIITSQRAQIISEENYSDNLSISISILNLLSCTLEVDDVRLCLVNSSKREMWFTSGEIKISEGRNEVKMSCQVHSHPGMYMVDISQIRLSKVIVQNQHRYNKDKCRSPILVEVPEDLDAIDAEMEMGQSLKLDHCRMSSLIIWTGKSNLDYLKLKLLDKSKEEAVNGFMEASLELKASQGDFTCLLDRNADDGEIIMQNIPAKRFIRLAIPLLDYAGPVDGIVHFIADLKYTYSFKGVASIEKERHAQIDLSLSIGLPLGVNVQDFYRHDHLFSNFLITAGAAGDLRIGAVELTCEATDAEGNAPFEITGPSTTKDMIVTPADTASLLFRISKVVNTRIADRNLRLKLQYQTKGEMMLDRIGYHLEECLKEHKTHLSMSQRRQLKRTLASFFSNTNDTQSKSVRSILSDRRLQMAFARFNIFHDSSNTADSGILAILKETLQVLNTTDTWLPRERISWRELILLVDVPSMNVVNAVTVKVHNLDEDKHVGQIVRATLHIETSFHWDLNDESETQEIHKSNEYISASNADDEDGDFQGAKSEAGKSSNGDAQKDERESDILLSMDVQCDFINWLILGSKRSLVGINKSKLSLTSPSSTKRSILNQVEISMIPLKAGDLILPSITIWPLTEILEKKPLSHAHRNRQDNVKQLQEERNRLNERQSIACDTHITNEGQIISIKPPCNDIDRRIFWIKL